MTRLFACWFLAGLALWGAYCIWFYFGENYEDALSHLDVPPERWQIIEGEGGLNPSGFAIDRPGRLGEAFAVGRLAVAFPAESMHRLEVEFSQVGTYQAVSVGVSGSRNLSQIREVQVGPISGNGVEVARSDLMPGRGDVRFISMRIRGGLEPAFVLKNARLYRSRPGFVELQRLILESFFTSGSWTQRSINHAEPDYTPLNLSPVLVFVLWIGISLAVCWALLTERVRAVGVRSKFSMLAVAVFIGWMLLDMSWQWALWSRHWSTVEQYAGLLPAEKRLTEGDSELFAFIQDLKEVFPRGGKRLVIFAGSEYAQFRTRYFSIPLVSISHNGINEKWLRRLQGGDVVALVDSPHRFVKEPITIDESLERDARDLSISTLVGRSGRLYDCKGPSRDVASPCEEPQLALKKGSGPWLVDSPWLTDLPSGLWRIELVLKGGASSGWARAELFRRTDGVPERWAWRGSYVPAGRDLTLSLPFWVGDAGSFKFRLADIEQVALKVIEARIEPINVSGDWVQLGLGKGPPYFIARKVLHAESGSAWQLL